MQAPETPGPIAEAIEAFLFETAFLNDRALTVAEIAQHLGRSEKVVRARLVALQMSGLVEASYRESSRNFTDMGGHWVATDVRRVTVYRISRRTLIQRARYADVLPLLTEVK